MFRTVLALLLALLSSADAVLQSSDSYSFDSAYAESKEYESDDCSTASAEESSASSSASTVLNISRLPGEGLPLEFRTAARRLD